jgi:hypothetical protein
MNEKIIKLDHKITSIDHKLELKDIEDKYKNQFYNIKVTNNNLNHMNS